MEAEQIKDSLLRARQFQRLTQTELGKKAGEMCYTAISHFESGRRIPTVKTLVKLCKAQRKRRLYVTNGDPF